MISKINHTKEEPVLISDQESTPVGTPDNTETAIYFSFSPKKAILNKFSQPNPIFYYYPDLVTDLFTGLVMATEDGDLVTTDNGNVIDIIV